MADARFDITSHAVERYLERYAVGATFAQGRLDLERLLTAASPLKEKSISGQELWRCAEPPMLFVVKPDGGKIVCVTVLPQAAMEGKTLRQPTPDDDVDEVLAAYERVKPLIEKVATKAECNQSIAGWRGKAERLCAQMRSELIAGKAKREQLGRDVRALLDFCKTGDVAALENAYGAVAQTRSKVGTPKTTTAEVHDLRARCGALERKLVKQVEHGKRMSEERHAMAQFLAVAVRGLMASKITNTPNEIISAVRHALWAIENANPRFLDVEFWNREIPLKEGGHL